jgi:YaiO family outer membrane protein
MKSLAMGLSLCALALATPGVAQTVEEDYRAAVEARQAGKPAEALARLARAAEREPTNADIRLQIGLAHLALGNLDEAEAAFRRTLALAPDYADARLGLARVAYRRGDYAAAHVELDGVALTSPEADALRRQVRAAEAARPWRWSVQFDGSYTDVERAADWQSGAVLIQHRPAPGTTLAASVETTRRFERTDVYGEARLDHEFAPGAHVHLLAGGAPDADHRPSLQVGAGVSVRVTEGPYATVLRLDGRVADYPAGQTEIVTPGIEQYLGGSVWVTGQWINVWDSFAHSSGWLLRADAMPNDRLRLFAGAADAPDLDSGVVIRTTSLFAGLFAEVGGGFTLGLSLAHDDPERGGDRTTGSLGLGVRF